MESARLLDRYRLPVPRPTAAWSTFAAVLAVALVASLAPQSAANATTGNDNEHDRKKSYCAPASPPGWTLSELQTVIQTATDEWERAPDYQGGGPSLNLTHIHWNIVEGCVSDVDVVFVDEATIGVGNVGRWVPDSDPGGETGEIWLNDTVDWRKPAQATTGQQLSLLGVLVHEIGHSVGIWHTGDEVWSFDNEVPTMMSGTSAQISQDKETIQQDDLGSVQWIDFKNRVVGRFFSDDMSFEGPFPGNWGRYDPANVSQTSAVSLAGDKSVILTADNAGVFITSVFDPFKEETASPYVQMPGMNPSGDGKHKFQVFTSFKETGSGGDVRIGYQWTFVEYDPAGSKNVGTLNPNWTLWTEKVCTNNGAGWQACLKGQVFDLDNFPVDEGAVAFRVRVLAEDADVYVDRVGARRRDP